MSVTKIIKRAYRIVENYIFPIRSSSEIIGTSIYDQEFIDDNGNIIDLSFYKGKKLLIVNTASACGFTGQYKELQELNVKHSEKVNVIAFPCNDFGKQEQGTNAEIQEFCQSNFSVTFRIFPKTKIRNTNETNLFYWLSHSKLNGWNDQSPLWNFWKFLIDENGRLIAVFPSRVNPKGRKVIQLIMKNQE